MEFKKTASQKHKNIRLLARFVVAVMLLIGTMVIGTGCQTPTKDYRTETKSQKDKRMEWWRQARFGMFIHWGLYAVPGGEWNDRTDHAEWIMNTAQIPVDQYEQFASQFNPVKFDADKWSGWPKMPG